MLQTLMVVMLLATIAVMVIKWNLGRYTLVNRVTKSAAGTVRTQGYASKNQMTWGTPPNASGTIDQKQISFTGTPSSRQATRIYVTKVAD